VASPVIVVELPPQAKYAVFYVRYNAQVPFAPIQSFHGVALPTGADVYTWAAWFATLSPGGNSWYWPTNTPVGGSNFVIWRNLVCGNYAGGIWFTPSLQILDCGYGFNTGQGYTGSLGVSGGAYGNYNLYPMVWHFAGVSRNGSSAVAVIDGQVVGQWSNLATYSYTGTDSWLFGADNAWWGSVAIAYIAIYTEALSLDDLLAIYNGARISGAVGEYIGDNYDSSSGVWYDSSGNGNNANCYYGSSNCSVSPSGTTCTPCTSTTPTPYKVPII